MKKNIWIGVLVAAVAALAVMVGTQSHEIEMLRAEKQMMVAALAEKIRATPAPVEETPAPNRRCLSMECTGRCPSF